jgi:hypothetical protein
VWPPGQNLQRRLNSEFSWKKLLFSECGSGDFLLSEFMAKKQKRPDHDQERPTLPPLSAGEQAGIVNYQLWSAGSTPRWPELLVSA